MNNIMLIVAKFTICVLFIITFSQITFAQKNTLITETSVGDIKLGMTIKDARKVLPKNYKLGPTPGDEGSTLIGVFEGDKLLLVIGAYGELVYEKDSKGEIKFVDENGKRIHPKLPPIDDNQKITSIGIVDSRYKTADGVHVGMTIAEAEKRFGKLKEMYNFPHGGETGEFTNQPKAYGFGFKPKGDEDEAGIYTEIPDCQHDYPPMCRVAVKYKPGSYISGMAVNAPEEKTARWEIKLNNLPKDLKVSIYGPTKCIEDGNGDVNGVATFHIWKTTGNITDYQEIEVNSTTLPCVDEHQAETRSNDELLYVIYDDFNFDGVKDLALYDGNNGGYGSPSYQVYLYSTTKKAFVHFPSYTKLTQHLGMFKVNDKEKMLYVYSKSGCCFHQTEGYTIRNNKPFKTYEYTTDATGPNGADDPKVTTKKLVNGKWRTWDRNTAVRLSFDKGKTSKTFSVKLSKNEPLKWIKVGGSRGQMLSAELDSPNAVVRIVDFKGDVSFYDCYESLEEGKELPVKLKGNGNYYLELSAVQDVIVNLKISIK